MEELKHRGIAVEFLDNPALNTDTQNCQFVLTILGDVAELERSVIRERQMEGIAIAKAAGKYQKKPQLSDLHIEQARRRVDSCVPNAVVTG